MILFVYSLINSDKKMEILSKKEILNGLNIFKFNPYSRIETTLRKKKLAKQKKILQLKLAIISGGIKKMK
jgi:hypothetical protein